MNQQQLIDALTLKANHTYERSLTKADIKAVLDALDDIVTQQMQLEGGEVILPGIGKFKETRRAARTGRNPQTGAAIEIAAKNGVKFVPAKALLDDIA
jgi:DNA-binding protein HU-beta